MKRMELKYPKKRSQLSILEDTQPAMMSSGFDSFPDSTNLLCEGNNLSIMRALCDQSSWKGAVDLVYIDPPFATNSVFRHNHKRTATVSSSKEDSIAYVDTRQGAEFIEFLRERLIFIRELMADHASIYLHIDYKIGHYVKVMMDEVFGPAQFRSDISRIKCNPKNFARKGFGNMKDLILFYTKGDTFTWNEPRVDMSDDDLQRLFSKVASDGRRYTTTPLHAPGETTNGNTGKPWKGMKPPKGRHWRNDPAELDRLDEAGLIEWSKTGNPRKIIYAEAAAEKGKLLQDIWEFKDPQYPVYPTEKNSDLLQTIICASSNPGDTVLDCFCGSGTTLAMASKLGRRWIGIDESAIAIETTKKKLSENSPDLFQKADNYSHLKEIVEYSPIYSGSI